MRCAVKFALIAVGFVVSPLPGWPQQQVPVPGTGDPGYSISQTDSTQEAPEGYEGRTHNLTVTSVGRAPATAGRVFVLKITLGNEIKICPHADGTAEGDGLFTASVEYNDQQGNLGHIAMSAKAKYKGQVGDNGFLDGPVKADIDYTYSVSGRFPDQSGVIFSPKSSGTVQQHVTMDVGVVPGMGVPTLSGFALSNLEDPGHFSNALDAAAAVAYWGGVYFGIAETKWTQGGCVLVAFDPPSNTVQPAPGTQVKVKVQVKTRTGEITKASLGNVVAYVGSVEPGGGVSDVGAPMTFTYTAPSKAPPSGSLKPGFAVDAVSRAGVAKDNFRGKWEAGLGKDWSGQITYSSTYSGDQGQGDLQSWSLSNSTYFNVEVQNGAAEAYGHSEETDIRINLHNVAQNGHPVPVPDNSDTTQGTASGGKHGKVSVEMDTSKKTYSIQLDVGVLPPGKAQTVSCMRDKGCNTTEMPFYVVPDFNGLAGSYDDPNHVHGTKTTTTHGLGRGRSGTRTDTLTWDLARQGATK
jgi:hypothetical protein